jgi:hypothetical protein
MTACEQAQAVAADPDALAAWEVGLIDLPPEVEASLRASLNAARRARDWIDTDAVRVIGTDDDR